MKAQRVRHILSTVGWGRVLTVLALMGGLLFAARPQPAEAHCDAINGPVVHAAQKSLDTGNVKYILAYVPKESEAELTAAFKQARDVRKLGSQARTMADQYFFETAVRLHRQGEGAAYTGLNMETDHGPALEAAGVALQNGKLEPVHDLLASALEQGLADRYAAVVEARKEATRLGTVEALREQAEAELMFEKYVFEVYSLLGAVDLHEGGGHQH